MRIAVSMYSYNAAVQAGRLDLPSFIHEAGRAGAEGVELLDYYYPGGGQDADGVERSRAGAMEALAEAGLPVPIFSVGNNFAKPDPKEREAQVGRIRFGVDEALAYGAGVVRVFAGDVAPGLTFDQVRAWIVEGLAAASTYAHERGIRLALENHGKLAGRGDQVRGLIDDVRAMCGNDALGANPDTGNFLLVDQPSHDAISQVAPVANMVHFKDFAPAPADHKGWAYESLAGKRYLGACVGEGLVELESCIDRLRDAGFDGWLSVEYEGLEDPLVAVPRSIANARRFL